MEWIETKKIPPPDFPTTGKTIIGAWLYKGEIETIDHLTFSFGQYWNQNTANQPLNPPDLYFVVPDYQMRRNK